MSVPEAGSRKKVVILGGGYAGVSVAKLLDRIFDVTVVDKNNYLHHKVGNLRAASNKEFAPMVLIPYDRFLKDGSVIQAEVTGLSESTVSLKGTDNSALTLTFDFLVIATGAAWTFPASPAATDAREAVKELEACSADLDRASKVLIIGGGAVGVELAAEIIFYRPKTAVTLVHRSGQLVTSGLSDKFYANLVAKLKGLGVTVVLNEQVENIYIYRGRRPHRAGHPGA